MNPTDIDTWYPEAVSRRSSSARTASHCRTVVSAPTRNTTSKVGGRLDLDVVFLAGADTTVRQCDAVRAELERRLTASGHHVSMSVGFTGDRRWAT